MSYRPDTPFDSIESAHEFVGLLEEAISEAKRDVATDLTSNQSQPDRRVDAQRLAHYKLERLEHHLHNSSRLLNDLRSLRRLLFEERESREATGSAGNKPRAA